MHSDQQNHQSGLTVKAASNYVTNCVILPLTCVGETFLHQRMGPGVYPPFIHLIAWLSPVPFFMIWADKAKQAGFTDAADNPVALSYVPVAFLAMTALHRLDRLFRRVRIESGYTGRPMLLNVLPSLGELVAKRVVEPGLLVLGGLLAIDNGINRPLASYAVAVGACMFISSCQRAAYEEWLKQKAFDAQEEGERAAARFREVNGR